ncbi:MAG: TIGR02996 domain-containing protein [Kofleriaceae bacterium]
MTAALEAAIEADPDARSGYAVYADWLQEQGDPRGELIAVQLAREDAPDDPALLARESELLAQHEDDWLGGVTSDNWPFGRTRVKWRRGFVSEAEVLTGYESVEAAISLAELLQRPVGRFVRALELGAAIAYNGRAETDDISLFELLRDHPLPTLRRLRVTCFDDDISWTHVGDVSIANPSLCNLEQLTLEVGRFTLGKIELPALQHLTLVTGGLRAHVLASIASARWPALEQLDVFLGTADYGGDCTPRDVVPILAGENLPRVTRLALCNGTFGDELVERVLLADILPRLIHLDLSKGTMGIDGGRLIARNLRRFTHLESFDLSENYLSPALCEQLSAALPAVNVSAQKLEGQYGRYVTISE